MTTNSNINGDKIKKSLKDWVCSSPFIHGIFSNPFSISILILIIINLLDMLYGKSFENKNTREIVQHSFTALFIMITGFFLNNLTISKCDKSIVGSKENLYNTEIQPVSISNNTKIDKYDDIMATYI